MKSFVTGGTTRRTACGTTTRHSAVERFIPGDPAQRRRLHRLDRGPILGNLDEPGLIDVPQAVLLVDPPEGAVLQALEDGPVELLLQLDVALADVGDVVVVLGRLERLPDGV